MTFRLINGVFFSVFIGVLVMLLAPYLTFTNSIILGLLLGILINNLFKIPDSFDFGIGFTSSKMLEISVVLLAFGINYKIIATLGAKIFLVVIITIILVVFLTIYLSKKFNCPSSIGWLTGFGTAICGSSAIAALAPSVTSNKDDIGVAMAVVNLYGALGMLAIPLLISGVKLDDTSSSLFIGGTLHSVGNVAGAGYAISDQVGDLALTIKLARVSMLTPALILMSFLVKQQATNLVVSKFYLPWYLIAFIIISIILSFVKISDNIIQYSALMGKWILTFAMVAIGLKIKFKSLIKNSKKGLMFGFLIFLIQIIIIFILMTLF